ncbi:MAG TPA: helical backbone metal receptor [Candidatus Polarisedimenticolia bacterium]|nr:helical backbone metal receptor [Candidatus Polarisedimenticolia bacterium]
MAERHFRAAVALLLTLAACRDRVSTSGGPIVAVDGLGRSVSLPAIPRRVVSLAPGVTESLFALGFADRVVGVSNFCALPPGHRSVRRVGGLLNPSLETIRELRPDLLLATTSGNDPALASQATALGLPLYTLDTPNVEATLQSLVGLATLLGDRERGVRLETRLRERLQIVHARLAGLDTPRLLFVVWGDPLVVPGRPAYLTDALARAGGFSVTADAPAAWPAFDLESAIARAPEVILTTSDNLTLRERLIRDPAWERVPAVRGRRIYVVGDAIQRPGPGVVDGIEEVARLLHPEAFGALSAR